MKALTVSQPYASLIAAGAKWVENRTWPTAYRGPLAIHAGRGRQFLSQKQLKRWPHGAIIAVADLVGCLDWAAIEQTDFQTAAYMQQRFQRESGKSVMEVIAHTHAEGPVCWVLANVRLVEPVEVRGAQGLWDYDGPLVDIDPAAAALGPLSEAPTAAPTRTDWERPHLKYLARLGVKFRTGRTLNVEG